MTTIPAALRRPPVATVLLAGLVLLASWPSRVMQPRDGLDPSWILGLHLAGDAGLHLGQDVVFTFGPLGTLARPVNLDAGALVPGMVVRFTVMALVAGLVVHHGRRVFGLWRGLLVAALVAPPLLGSYGRGADPEVAIVLYALGLVALLRRDLRSWHAPVSLVLAVVVLLAKVSSGFTALGLWVLWLAVAVVRASRSASSDVRRLLVWLPAGLVLSALLVALVGFSPSGFVDFLRHSLELTLGFAAGMHDAHHRTLIHLAAFLVPTAILLWVSVVRWRDAKDPAAVVAEFGAVLLVAAFAFTRFKYGFTREGPGHLVPAVGAILLLLLVQLPARRDPLEVPRASALLAAFLGLLVVLEPGASRPWTPIENLRAASSDLLTLASANERADDREVARQELLDSLAIGQEVAPPPGTLHVDPWDISAVWALDRVDDWRPPPVFQSYHAFTPSLDRLNADHFLGPEAPAWVLRRPRMIDGRNPAWDPPRHLLSLACGWDHVAGEGKDWSLLRHRERPVCDALADPVARSSVTAQLGEWVPVPDVGCDGQPTVMTLEPEEDGLLARVRTLAWVPPVWTVEARLADGGETRWRWLPAFAGEPMLLAMPDDPAAGPVTWPLLGSSRQIAEVRLVRADDVLQAGDEVDVTFGCQP